VIFACVDPPASPLVKKRSIAFRFSLLFNIFHFLSRSPKQLFTTSSFVRGPYIDALVFLEDVGLQQYNKLGKGLRGFKYHELVVCTRSDLAGRERATASNGVV